MIIGFKQTNIMKQLSLLIGDNIRKQRKLLDINQEKLALLADIDRSYMGRIERGEVNITIEKLYKISKVLKCPPQCLLPDIDEILI